MTYFFWLMDLCLNSDSDHDTVRAPTYDALTFVWDPGSDGDVETYLYANYEQEDRKILSAILGRHVSEGR